MLSDMHRIFSAMHFLLVLGLFVVLATAHNITLLEVPTYGDPRGEVQLSCHYENEKRDPPLHSVKWYKDNNEIFRFSPEMQPPTRIFNTTGVDSSVARGSCDMQSCKISVVLPKRYNTRMSYTCEVSTEGPRFAVVKQSKELTIAVALNEDPIITGVPESVQPGEELFINCSTRPAMPPANIVWFIDGKPEETEPWADNTETFVADDFGLRASWRTLRLRVSSTQSLISLRCEATQPTRPPNLLSKNVTLVVARSPHLSMFTAYGSGCDPSPLHSGAATLIVLTLLSVHMLSEFSAFRDYVVDLTWSV